MKTGRTSSGGFVNDAILGSSDPKDNRRLLVRILQAEAGQTERRLRRESACAIQQRVPPDGLRASSIRKRLTLQTDCVDASCKVLLYAYREGKVLPTTRWRAPEHLKLSWPKQTDQLDFSRKQDGLLHLRLQRA